MTEHYKSLDTAKEILIGVVQAVEEELGEGWFAEADQDTSLYAAHRFLAESNDLGPCPSLDEIKTELAIACGEYEDCTEFVEGSKFNDLADRLLLLELAIRGQTQP